MSESNPIIPSSSQGNELLDDSVNKGLEASQISECDVSSVSESDKPESAKSNASAALGSKIARPTGLKLPSGGNPAVASSRIARLCNNSSKPTATPNQNLLSSGTGLGGGSIISTQSSVSKISEELARKGLMDSNEMDENRSPNTSEGKCYRDRKMSGGSVLSDSSCKSGAEDLIKKRSSDASISADALSDFWKPDFEPRRVSDASVVLTENTDQFIIGDRVWVGGSKPGQIAYIGETQFAPGEWAGVVLDEPIGKNDGTVANVRYFQCEPKKGIFSRLTRLTRYPLIDGGAEKPAASKSMPLDTKKSNGSLLTPAPKKSPLVLTPTVGLKNSLAKPTSPDSALHPGLVVGDRVIVKSSQGSKAGVLRYLGTTEFAPGEWCGVELDDPLGKNDGSVSGKRYFECRPQFGLFAPLHKVSRSPANKRMFQVPCAIHRGGVSTGIRRQGSKESLVSLSSTASTTASVKSVNRKVGVRAPTTPTSTKNALLETLKEKELHIEQLLKERDLERAEVTRAASQADEAERQLASFKKEFEQQKEEAEARVTDLDAMICLLKAENEEMANQLEDEKKKFEDLLFRFEEETIDKADIKSTILKYEEKINLLEKTLSEERKRAEAMEHDSNKLFEAEEQMVIMKDELDTTKEELQEHKKIRATLEQEQISLGAHLTSARAEIESLKIENQSLKTSSSEDENTLKESLTGAIKKLEETEKELSLKHSQIEQLSKDLENKQQTFSEKEKELHAKYVTIMQELTEKHKGEMNNLSENMKNDSETKLKVLENQLQEKIKFCNTLEEKLNEVTILLSKSNAEKTLEQNNYREMTEKFEKKLMKCTEELQEKNAALNEEAIKVQNFQREVESLRQELMETKNSLSSASKSIDKQIDDLNDIIKNQKREVTGLKEEIKVKSKECENLKELESKNKKEYEEKVKEMNEITKRTDSELKKTKDELEKVKEEFNAKNKELQELYQSHEEAFKSKIKHLEDNELERKAELDRLNRALETSRNSLEVRESELKSEQTNCKNLAEKLMALEENYARISEEKDQLELEAGDAKRKLQSTADKLNQVTSQKNKLESDISTFINSSNDSSLQLTTLNEELRAKEKEMDSLTEELAQKTRNFERIEQELKQMLEKQEDALKTARDEFEVEKNNHKEEIVKLKNKLDVSTIALRESEEKWKKKADTIAQDAENQIKNLQEKIRSWEIKEIEDRKKHEKLVKEFTNIQNELHKKLEEVKLEANETKSTLEKKIQELDAQRINLLETVDKTTAEFLENEKKLEENEKKYAELLTNESEKLRNELKTTNETLTSALEELSRAKEEKNKLNEEKLKLETTSSSMEDILKQTQAKNSKLLIDVSSVESENKILKETINQLREEKCHLEKDTTDKMMLVTELTSKLNTLENSKKTSDSENENKLESLIKEVSELKEKLQKTEATHSSENLEKQKLIQNLEKEIENFKKESSQIISGKEKDMENVNSIVAQIKKELNESKHEYDKKCEQVDKLQKNVQLLQMELEGEKKKGEENKKKCDALETERIQLKEKFEEQSNQLVNAADLTKKLAEVSNKLKEAEKREEENINSSKLEKKNLETILETTKNLLNQKENETKALTKEIDSLNLKITELQKLEKTKLSTEKVQKNGKTEEANHHNVIEECDFEKGQIDFLNSVIVDMQKKNDALKARIEILEMGYSPEDVDEFNLHNINTRAVAPRLFCDICDRFDLHDTEDCPTQAADDEPPPKSSKSKVPPPERPYCDICEVFGHDTENCDDGETF